MRSGCVFSLPTNDRSSSFPKPLPFFQSSECPFDVQFQAVASLAELLSVLPADAALAYQEDHKWLQSLLGAPRVELRRESAILYAQIFARASTERVVDVLTPLLNTAMKRCAAP